MFKLKVGFLLDKNNNWMFLITDLVLYKGTKLNCNIVDRFNKLYDLLENDYTEDSNMDICPLRIKRLFDYSEYNYLITQFIPRIEYNIRGLYFNTLNPKHCNQLFIYKETQHRVQKKQIDRTEEIKTYEIRTTMQPEIYDLFQKNSEGELVRFDVAHISGIKASKLVRQLFEKKDTHVYVRCKFNKKFNKWEPYDKGQKEDIVTLST